MVVWSRGGEMGMGGPRELEEGWQEQQEPWVL